MQEPNPKLHMKIITTGEGNTVNGELIHSVEKAPLEVIGIEERIRLSKLYVEQIKRESAKVGVDPSDYQVDQDSTNDEFVFSIYFSSIANSLLVEAQVQIKVDGTYIPKRHSVTGLPVIRNDKFVYIKVS